MTSKMVWIVDDDRSIRWVLDKAFTQEGFSTRAFEDADKVLNVLESGADQPDVLLSDVRMPGTDGLRMLSILQRKYPQLPVIIMTAHSDLESAVASYQGGAFEYLPKPFDIDEAVALVRRACQKQNEQDSLRAPAPQSSTEIIGEAAAMQNVFRAIGRLSHSNVTVLISGESGTGKELVARALHRHSMRKDKPFVALNMAAIPKDLIESELFGHEKGSFTGASGQRVGRFEQANNGTLFLDEIGDMPLEAQTRLLRVLQEGEFYRVGGNVAIKVNVRIVAATHQHLDKLVASGGFREDLFHRLNVIRIHMPKLAERREDIPQLARYFLQRAAQELAVEAKTLHQDVEQYFTTLPWPGNVRQIENVCRWLTVMAAGREVLLDDLPVELQQQSGATDVDVDWQKSLRLWASHTLMTGADNILSEALPAFEKVMIEAALQQAQGRRGDAAVLLGWGRNTLTRKLKDLGLESSLHPSQD